MVQKQPPFRNEGPQDCRGEAGKALPRYPQRQPRSGGRIDFQSAILRRQRENTYHRAERAADTGVPFTARHHGHTLGPHSYRFRQRRLRTNFGALAGEKSRTEATPHPRTRRNTLSNRHLRHQYEWVHTHEHPKQRTSRSLSKKKKIAPKLCAGELSWSG